MFFLDKDTPDNKSGKNIFISTVENGKQTVTTARTGRVVTEGETQFLLLSDGQRLERQLDGSKLKVSEFQDLGNKVGGAQLGPQDNAPSKTLSTWALVASPTSPNLGDWPGASD